MVGAEGVVENGGIVNKIGTYTIAICAKMLNKPVYVFCESFKFVRMYPLNQKDLKDEFKYHASTLKKVTDLSSCHPLVDYTNPSLITLLFTDLGILTPSAVSDELIQLYLWKIEYYILVKVIVYKSCSELLLWIKIWNLGWLDTGQFWKYRQFP